MFDKFTDRSRKVIALAKEEAQGLNHEYLGTEHVLLGLIKERAGVAHAILKSLDVDLVKARTELERFRHAQPAENAAKGYETPGFKKLVEHAMEECRALNHSYVGTEHLLLALVRDSGNVGSVTLQRLGVNLGEVRSEILKLLGHGI